MRAPALVLTRSDIAALASVRDYHDAVEGAFRAFAEQRTHAPPPMEIYGAGGAIHVKGASVAAGGDRLAAVKVNANFPGNPSRGLPTIQGAVLLSDATTGVLLAVMDSIEVTLRRTAAASAVAADLLALASAKTLFICGCGVQGRAHLDAIAPLRPFERILAYDADRARAARFSGEMTRANAPPIEIAESIGEAAAISDVIVTVTTSSAPLPLPDDLAAGAFIAAVGADNPMKSEIAPSLMARAAVFADVADQCVVMGDLRAAIAAGAMSREDLRGELGEILVGAKAGRRDDREIVIFDSTGAAFQDLAAAAMIFERAKANGIGASVDLQR